ncbi:MAG: hypothetical protein ACRC42_01735 [Mycoplasma sp.]
MQFKANNGVNSAQNQTHMSAETPAQGIPSFRAAPKAANVGHKTAVDHVQGSNIEEKVAQLSLQFNQILVKPYLQQALDYLKSSKAESTATYNQLSDQIANEINIITQNANIISVRLKEANDTISHTQEIIRNKYNNATEQEISTGELNLEYEYNIVAENYELSLQLSQEISNYKTRVSSLLNLQNLLDSSTVPFVSRIQVEIDNLELLIHNFDSSSYAEMVAKNKKNIDFVGASKPLLNTRFDEVNKMAEDFKIQNAQSQNTPKQERAFRRETSANKRIETDQYADDLESSRGRKAKRRQRLEELDDSYYSAPAPAQVKNDEPQLSREEEKLLRKMREQELKFEHMMKMNDLVFKYNKRVDEMMAKQKEYELQQQAAEAERQRAFDERFGTQSNGYNSNQTYSYKPNNTSGYKPMGVRPSSQPKPLPQPVKKSFVKDIKPLRESKPGEFATQVSKSESSKSIRVVR